MTAAIVLAGYVYFASLGTWTRWPRTSDYYDRLASAFIGGHLYVKESPDPSLLALPNPYDPDARKGIAGLTAYTPGSIWDMSLYRGRVYLYWGPAPALLLLPFKAITHLVFGDQFLTLAFLAGAFLFESLLLIHLWRRYFAGLSPLLVLAAMLLTGFANPIPWLLFSPRIYEAAIAAGQFFLMGGLYFVLTALDRDVPSPWRLAVCSALWVGAAGSRATLAVAVAYLAIVVLAWLLLTRGAQGMRAALSAAVWFAVPLLLGAALLAWYNFARFGSVFEFGFRYAITMLDQNKYHAVLFSWRYLVPNAYLYLLNPPAFTAQFPFIRPVWNGEYVAAFNDRYHTIYNAERIVGLVYAAPFLLIGLLAPVAAVARLRGSARRGNSSSRPSDRFFSWFLLALSGLGTLLLLVIFLVFYSTMRYFMDATPTLALTSVLGFWLVHQRLAARPAWRRLFTFAALLLLLITVAASILVGFYSDLPRLRAANPALLTHLRLFFTMLARRLSR